MNDSSSREAEGRAPASGGHFLALSGRPLKAADVWTALPSSRREPAQDYLAQGRVAHRCRRGTAHLALVRGYQDDYHVYCEDVAAGWQVGCSCARRMPCAHVGSVLLAVAASPESFRPWQTLLDQLGGADDWAWFWARGGDFPWQRATDADPLVLAPAGPDDALPSRVVDLAAARGARLAALLLDIGRWAHAGWWEHPGFVRAFGEAVERRRQHEGCGAEELTKWVALVAGEPRLPARPLFLGAANRHPAVRAAWIRELASLDAAHALDPKPSQALAARALLDLPVDGGPDPVLGAAWVQRFRWALPGGVPAAERLLQQGRAAEGWWALVQSPAPDGADDFWGDGAETPGGYRSAVADLIRRHITGGA